MQNKILNTIILIAVFIVTPISVFASVEMPYTLGGTNNNTLTLDCTGIASPTSYKWYFNNILDGQISNGFPCGSTYDLNGTITASGDGIARFEYYTASSYTEPITGYFEVQRVAGVWNTWYATSTTNTRIIEVAPTDDEVIPLGENEIYTMVYTTEEDFDTDLFIRIKYRRSDDEFRSSTNLSNLYTTLKDIPITYSGYFFSYPTTTIDNIGRYTIMYELRRDTILSTFLGFFSVNTDSGLVDRRITTFIASTTTAWDDTLEQINNEITDLYSTTTPISMESCGITNFNLITCTLRLINILFFDVDMTEQVGDFKERVLYKFPIGIVTSVYDIMSTTTVGTLTIIDATTTPALGFGEHHIRLDLTNVLDRFLYATTGVFTNSSAPDTRTLYEITSDYWEIIVTLGVIIYMLGRILGFGIIPTVSQGSINTVTTSEKKGNTITRTTTTNSINRYIK